ncbi:MAG: hypothetical protein R3B99_13035 [Polyangiales bacterium]
MRGLVLATLALLASACQLRELEVLSSGSDGGMRDAGGRDAFVPPVDGGPSLPPGALVAATYGHTCAIFGSALVCWGNNGRGQLTSGSPSGATPTIVPLETAPVSVALGARSTCVLDAVGDVRCVGANDRGQLGLGDTTDRGAFERLDLPPAREITTGHSHACALLADARLLCWGRNDEGELGLGIPDLDDQPTPREVVTGNAWARVSAGQGHTLAVTVQGLMVGFGRNSDSELGLGPSAPIQRRTPTEVGDGTWRDVAAGQSHSCALSSTNEVHCFGSNASAQLGLGDFADRDVPTPLGLPDADVVATNTFHGCAIRLGELHCWGRNVEGQLGTGDVEDRPSPTRIGTETDWTHVACGRFYTCARKRDGRVLCTGANESGQLGVGDFERRRVFTDIAFGTE